MTLLNKELKELVYRVLIKCPYYEDEKTAELIANAIFYAQMLDLKCNGSFHTS